jgi:hypothetical protein
MRLYLVSQDKNKNYDTYDSVVVAAESEEQARNIHPAACGRENTLEYSKEQFAIDTMYSTWVKPDQVEVELISATSIYRCTFFFQCRLTSFHPWVLP